VRDKIHPHSRDAGEASDTFVLNVLEGCDNVPLVHENKLVALQHRRKEDCVRACHVKKRHGAQAAALLAFIDAAFASGLLGRNSDTQRVNCAHDSAVGRQRALWVASGTAGIKKRGVVVLLQVNVRQCGPRVRC
jgi:hypothetical protein